LQDRASQGINNVPPPKEAGAKAMDMTTEEILSEINTGSFSKVWQKVREKYDPDHIESILKNVVSDTNSQPTSSENPMEFLEDTSTTTAPVAPTTPRSRPMVHADSHVESVEFEKGKPRDSLQKGKPRNSLFEGGTPSKAKLKEQYNQFIQESVSEGGFGGFEAHSSETFREAFGGDNAKRAVWLRKESKDLKISDVPVLLVDYQQLAAEHIVLLKRLNETDELLKKKK